MTDYQTVFRLPQLAPVAVYVVPGLFLILLGGVPLLTQVLATKRFPSRCFWRVSALLIGAFATGLGVVSLRVNKDLHQRCDAGQWKIVEGVVRVLREQPHGGHAPGDLIEVAGREFEIDYFRSSVGYKRTIARGGHLTEGTHARIYVIDGIIARLDVSR